MAEGRCEHFEGVSSPAPLTAGCAECMALGERDWVALRVCLSCGHVGCCEDSRYAHALAHFQASGHPLIRPFEAGDQWTWCYLHDRYFEGLAAPSRPQTSGWIRRWLHEHVGSRRRRRSR